MRYLVATDGSTESDEAIEYATRHAMAVDATLEIVHVLTPETELVEGEVVMPGEETALEQGEQILNRSQSLVNNVVTKHDDNIAVETKLLAGRPATAITEHADTTGVDTIYVGHRGLSDKREQVVGSVAKNVVDKATVPVTVIR